MSTYRAQKIKQKAAESALMRDSVGAITIPISLDNSFVGKGGSTYGPVLALKGKYRTVPYRTVPYRTVCTYCT